MTASKFKTVTLSAQLEAMAEEFAAEEAVTAARNDHDDDDDD
jgi:hypothetical protein